MLENSRSHPPLRLCALPVGVSPLTDEPELWLSDEWCRRCVAGDIILTSFLIDSPVSRRRAAVNPGVLGAFGVVTADNMSVLPPDCFDRSRLSTVAVSRAAKQHFSNSATVIFRFSSSSSNMEWSMMISWTYSFSMHHFSFTGIRFDPFDSERVWHMPETASSDTDVARDSRLQKSCSNEVSENLSASLSIVPFTLPTGYRVASTAVVFVKWLLMSHYEQGQVVENSLLEKTATF